METLFSSANYTAVGTQNNHSKSQKNQNQKYVNEN